MRLLRCNNAPRFLRSVRGIRDVFMSKREREGDLEPSSVPSPCLLSTDPRETGCFPSEFLSLLLSSNAFESIQTLYAFVVLQSWTRSLLLARTIDDLRNLKKEDTSKRILFNFLIRWNLLETRVQFSRSHFPELRSKRSFVSSKFASDYSWTGDFTIMEGNKDFRDSLQSVCPISKRNASIAEGILSERLVHSGFFHSSVSSVRRCATSANPLTAEKPMKKPYAPDRKRAFHSLSRLFRPSPLNYSRKTTPCKSLSSLSTPVLTLSWPTVASNHLSYYLYFPPRNAARIVQPFQAARDKRVGGHLL